jgi:aryl-alcohol dehydrogenase-like predicted oxidoreductase
MVLVSELDLTKLSAVGLGCNNFGMKLDRDQSRAVVHAALDAGVTFFDTADVYGGTRSESYLGEILGPHRTEVVIATKFGVRFGDLPGGLRAADVTRSAEASLTRLRTDYLDMFMVHYPASWMIAKGYPDADVPVTETLEALNRLLEAGKVRSIGCSNFSVAELGEANDLAAGSRWRGFAAVQNELSLLVRDAEHDMLPECERRGVVFIPYFPLASGLLTGKYRPGADYPPGSRMEFNPNGMWAPLFTRANFAAVERLSALAADRGRTLAEYAFGWLLSHPSVPSVIAGATSASQVRANATAAATTLAADELAELRAVLDEPGEAGS